MEIDRETLQIVFDVAVGSMNFTSGFLDNAEVDGLRAVAVILGVDPMVATPRNFICQYAGKHFPYGDIGHYTTLCQNCGAETKK
jgi:hypothetical protein